MKHDTVRWKPLNHQYEQIDHAVSPCTIFAPCIKAPTFAHGCKGAEY